MRICLMIISILFFACQNNEQILNISKKPILRQESAIQDSINSILIESKLINSIYENRLRAEAFKTQIANNGNFQTLFKYAQESLNSGDTNTAIAKMESVLVANPNLSKIDATNRIIHDFLAISYLRLGEQQNCQQNHSDESCIVPISGSGIYKFVNPTLKAIAKYEEILEVFPKDLQTRWLLNIAYMTIDQYPNKVPKQYLIPIGHKSTNPLFNNIATKIGVDDYALSGNVICDDFNNDNYLDIIVSSWGTKGHIKYYQNDTKGGFEDKTVEVGLDQVLGGLNIKQTDINNDGALDIYVMRGGWRPNQDWGILPNSLLVMNANGKYGDVTIESGLYSVNPTQSAEWFDCNNDGHLDLFIANETTKSTRGSFPCELFINDGKGHFTNKAKEYGVDRVGYFKGCSIGDIDNDGWSDIYLSNLDGNNLLLKAEVIDGTLVKYQELESGTSNPKQSFPCWFFDYNNDGWDDIFAASFTKTAFSNQSGLFAAAQLGINLEDENSCLYMNQKNNSFENVTDQVMPIYGYSTMGCNYGDINNDGYPDIYLGTGAPDYRAVVPNRLFVNKAGKQFADRTFEEGVGHIQKGHGISFADLDNDGDLDIYAVMGGAFEGDVFSNALFENQSEEQGFWLKLKLNGKESNALAIGAKVKVECKDGNGESFSIYHTINSGASFGANPIRAHIGLGQSNTIERILIKWPNGSNQWEVFNNLSPNTYYEITEGGESKTLPFKALTLVKSNKNSDRHHHHHHEH